MRCYKGVKSSELFLTFIYFNTLISLNKIFLKYGTQLNILYRVKKKNNRYIS